MERGSVGREGDVRVLPGARHRPAPPLRLLLLLHHHLRVLRLAHPPGQGPLHDVQELQPAGQGVHPVQEGDRQPERAVPRRNDGGARSVGRLVHHLQGRHVGGRPGGREAEEAAVRSHLPPEVPADVDGAAAGVPHVQGAGGAGGPQRGADAKGREGEGGAGAAHERTVWTAPGERRRRPDGSAPGRGEGRGGTPRWRGSRRRRREEAGGHRRGAARHRGGAGGGAPGNEPAPGGAGSPK